MVLRYINPNPDSYIGEITVFPEGRSAAAPAAEDGEGEVGSGPEVAEGAAPPQQKGEGQTYQVLLLPTDRNIPEFVTVSGDKGIFASPFDLEPGRWTVSVKIENNDPMAEEVLVDYFVLVPHEYYEPTILKEDVFSPCLAGGQNIPYCRQFSYPDVEGFPVAYSDYAVRPGEYEPDDVYAWADRPEVLGEIGARKLATLARWQPELEFDIMGMRDPGKHVLAIVFFTPEGVNGTKSIDVSAAETARSDQGKTLQSTFIFSSKSL